LHRIRLWTETGMLLLNLVVPLPTRLRDGFFALATNTLSRNEFHFDDFDGGFSCVTDDPGSGRSPD
jgi:hypothetical protein